MKTKVIIIGGGPTGLMCASHLAKVGDYDIHIFDAQKTVGRKLLVAGHGGFNLTHSEPIEQMITRYHNLSDWFKDAIIGFNNQAVIEFLEKEIGIPTYIGSSKRVFPEKGITPASVLKRWIAKLEYEGVKFHTNKKMIDFDQEKVIFEDGAERKFDALFIAFGGISWSKTGSDGNWIDLLKDKEISLQPFTASNVGVNIDWPKSISTKYDRQSIKYVAIKVGLFSLKGDIMLTEYGLEGTPIYAASNALKQNQILHIDFKPNNDISSILKKLDKTDKSISQVLKKDLKLDQIVIDLIKAYSSKEAFQDKMSLVQLIKNFPLVVNDLQDIEVAISSAGGIEWSNLNDNSSLKKFNNIFLGGEMLEWDAPTGGYLLQACFSSGAFAAKNIHAQLEH